MAECLECRVCGFEYGLRLGIQGLGFRDLRLQSQPCHISASGHRKSEKHVRYLPGFRVER